MPSSMMSTEIPLPVNSTTTGRAALLTAVHNTGGEASHLKYGHDDRPFDRRL